jgi:hypothetical protein
MLWVYTFGAVNPKNVAGMSIRKSLSNTPMSHILWNRLCDRPRHRWENNVKMDLKETV